MEATGGNCCRAWEIRSRHSWLSEPVVRGTIDEIVWFSTRVDDKVQIACSPRRTTAAERHRRRDRRSHGEYPNRQTTRRRSACISDPFRGSFATAQQDHRSRRPDPGHTRNKGRPPEHDLANVRANTAAVIRPQPAPTARPPLPTAPIPPRSGRPTANARSTDSEERQASSELLDWPSGWQPACQLPGAVLATNRARVGSGAGPAFALARSAEGRPNSPGSRAAVDPPC
jgi:hypothetical protein